ncbi:MAG: ABC transporter substrate-binding protein [Gammaproteobacteria bacterium]|nr:ABC transporter substrate-binding protein [Gammaproteobacteria bacterium]
MHAPLTTKDWITYCLLIILMVLVLLTMYQIDRQWLKLSEVQDSLSQQVKAVRELKNAVANGAVRTVAADNQAQNGVAPAFKRAYAASQLPDYAQGDWSVDAFGINLKTITPLISADAYAATINGYVLESLLTRNPDTLEWEGLIAKSWQISKDGLVITFQLRDDVAFSDGAPLTADDVVFTFDFIMNEVIQAPRDRAYLSKIKQVKANGKYEAVFIFKEPYFEALSLSGSMNILSKQFYSGYLKEPQKFNESKGLLIGSGPYKLADPKNWTPDKGNVELIRNDHYWGDVQPSFNRILWKIIQNDSARLTTFRNGDIDSYSARPVEYQTLKNDPQIKAKSLNFEYMPPIAGYNYIGWNQARSGKPTPFADIKVRQAMTYLTDVNRIIKDVFLNYSEPAVSPFSQTSKQHDNNLQPYAYDLNKAKSLLQQAGYEDRNGDGVLENKSGSKFEFKLTYLESSEDTKRMVLLLKDLYAKAGVRLIPFPQEWPVMLENLDKKDFDAITLGWTSGIETDLYQMFHSSQMKDNGDNRISYSNPKLDKLIEEARRTVDENKRMPLWQQAEHILYEDQPYTFLMRRKNLLFVDKRIHNLKMTKLGLNMGSLPMETYVPLNLQKYTQ